ncbi:MULTISPECIES: hypothetical protein [unclassified Pseudofrankia]|uniref:hypothetical protein n=1 Tax=unclassified Pseudofrankia TaxID=2994372 RepID=UPI0008D9EF78|nr:MULTISPECIES: hypothetical protein [unclassified Pseudofrankia]MDT3446861.1 hypothetical protein [Pseudofrankia sp. BMG5.37]OHV54728.1 hypothetical protein BCD48_44450 [Pseudofrankia sp. BMG5.36]
MTQPVRHVDAAVLRGTGGAYTVEAVGLSELGLTDVLVQIAGTGTCHTDLAFGAMAGDAFARAVLGHEGPALWPRSARHPGR